MKKILVTGANGQLAQCLKDASESLDKNKYVFLFLNKEQFDVSNKDLIESYFFSNKVDCVVNCAAYTAVDKAEEEVEKAFQINADAVGNLARECAEQGADFIHISTDYVFHGMSSIPFTEEDSPQPINVYGKSKLEGERLAIEHNPKAIIIRTAWVYSQYGNNFMKTMLRLFAERDELSIVSDQKGTPTNANDIANAILKIIQTENKTAGIYHFTNAGETTWFNFAETIKELSNSNVNLKPIPTSAYPTPAKRPQYSVLDTAKIQGIYGVEVPEWKESLNKEIEDSL